VGLLNVDGYYNLLLAFIDKAVDDGFIKPSQRQILISTPDTRDLVQKLEVIIL
jgi:cytokinin riboside 5'-monophosphate phosphoribohydrolase